MEAGNHPPKPDRGPELIGASVFLTVFGTSFVITRLLIRYTSIKSFGWDDIFIFFSMLAGLAGEGLTLAGAAHGYGKTMHSLGTPDLNEAMKCSNFGVFCNGMAMALLKVGIGMSLLRINLSRPFSIVIIICIILSLIVNLTVFGGSFAACQPIVKIWNKDPRIKGTCWPRELSLAFSYIQTVGNILTDLIFAFGPLVYLSNVKVSRYNKYALRGVFLVGLTATACAIAKATELPALLKTKDPTYDAVDLTIWVKAELNAGLFGASLPPLKSTFEKILRKCGVMTGLTTPKSTYYMGGSKNFRSRTRPSMIHHPDGDDGGEGGQAGYAMGGMNSRSQTDGESLEEDQRHILKPSSEHHGEWITKTTEYTVTHGTK